MASRRLLIILVLLDFLAAAVSACDDVAPDSKYSCQQQAQWSKCNEPWMKNKCNKSCGRCLDVFKDPSDSSAPVSSTLRTTPINPKATAETKKLYTALLKQYGKKILSGQQQSDKKEIEYIRQHSGGKEPVIAGYDFMDITHFGDRSKQKALMQRAINWSKKKGGVVTFCWHWRNPLGTPNVWKTLGFYSKETNGDDAVFVDLNQLSNTNSKEHKALIRDVDHVATYLKQAQSAKVPILFRPLHEAEGTWFWWGKQGPEQTKHLYRFLYERLVHHHGLNNLLWVWTTESKSSSLDWYPGDDLVDILGMDIYEPNDGKGHHNTQVVEFKKAKELFKGKKMIALTENGGIPDPTKLATDGAHWLWFSTWYGERITNDAWNTKAFIRSVFNHEHILTRRQFKV